MGIREFHQDTIMHRSFVFLSLIALSAAMVPPRGGRGDMEDMKDSYMDMEDMSMGDMGDMDDMGDMGDMGGECGMCIRGFMENEGCNAIALVMEGEMTVEDVGTMVPDECHDCAEGAAMACFDMWESPCADNCGACKEPFDAAGGCMAGEAAFATLYDNECEECTDCAGLMCMKEAMDAMNMGFLDMMRMMDMGEGGNDMEMDNMGEGGEGRTDMEMDKHMSFRKSLKKLKLRK